MIKTKLQGSIPVGCVPPTLYRRGVLSDRDPPGQRPPGQRPLTPWTESQTGVKTLPSHNFVCGR